MKKLPVKREPRHQEKSESNQRRQRAAVYTPPFLRDVGTCDATRIDLDYRQAHGAANYIHGYIVARAYNRS